MYHLITYKDKHLCLLNGLKRPLKALVSVLIIEYDIFKTQTSRPIDRN